MQYRKVRQDNHRSGLPRELIKDCKLFAADRRNVLAIVRDIALDINPACDTCDSTVEWEYFTAENLGKARRLLANLQGNMSLKQ